MTASVWAQFRDGVIWTMYLSDQFRGVVLMRVETTSPHSSECRTEEAGSCSGICPRSDADRNDQEGAYFI